MIRSHIGMIQCTSMMDIHSMICVGFVFWQRTVGAKPALFTDSLHERKPEKERKTLLEEGIETESLVSHIVVPQTFFLHGERIENQYTDCFWRKLLPNAWLSRSMT